MLFDNVPIDIGRIFGTGVMRMELTMSKNASIDNSVSHFPWWLYIIVILGAFLLAVGGLIALFRPAMLASPHDEINMAVHVYAGYMASRNLGLAAMLIAALSLRNRAMLNTVMLFAGLVQLLDAGIDCVEGRWIVVPGVIILGVLFFVASARLSTHPFWRIEAWKER